MADLGDDVDGHGYPPSLNKADGVLQIEDQNLKVLAPDSDGSQSVHAATPSKILHQAASNRHDQTPSKFPPLQNTLPKAEDSTSQSPSAGFMSDDGLDDGSGAALPFQRIGSPSPDSSRKKGAIYEKVGDRGVCKMHKFSVYETATRYYIVGADVMDRRFRILKIDRNPDAGNLSVTEDDTVYNKSDMSQLLETVDEGNKSSGGMKLKCSTWGLLGFIRFTGPYYMLLITKRSQVAMIGGHYVYQIDGTELVPLVTSQNSRFKPDSKNVEEARFLGILNNLDLSRSFYFSYSYDITHTLQHNMIKERDALAHNLPCPHVPDYNAMFVWNNYLLEPAADALKNTYDWCLPVIHGYIDQAGKSRLIFLWSLISNSLALSIYGRTVHITIIARRSRYFAGARFLKRGANDLVSAVYMRMDI
jgi:hypothetical protein